MFPSMEDCLGMYWFPLRTTVTWADSQAREKCSYITANRSQANERKRLNIRFVDRR
jgi:hypothetical protein